MSSGGGAGEWTLDVCMYWVQVGLKLWVEEHTSVAAVVVWVPAVVVGLELLLGWRLS